MNPRLPRGVVVAGAVAVALLVAALVGGRPAREGPPLDPRSDQPRGTSALVALLRELGATVELAVGLPAAADDVALVLQDRLEDDQGQALVEWVEGGGHLVVTEPGRLTPPMAGGGLEDLTARPVERGTCTIAALAAVERVDAGSPVRYETSGAGGSCLGDGSEAYVVTQQVGAGDVTAIGGAAALTNELLDERDNAVLAAALLAPRAGTTVRFVEPPLPAGGGDRSLAELVPAGVRRALLQLGVAFVLYALWRAIRLGKPVPEEQPVRIAGSELVAAVGRLLARTGRPEAAATLLRDRLRRVLGARVGVPPVAPPGALADAVATRAGVDRDAVLAAVEDRPVRGDGDLVATARAVSSITSEVLR